MLSCLLAMSAMTVSEDDSSCNAFEVFLKYLIMFLASISYHSPNLTKLHVVICSLLSNSLIPRYLVTDLNSGSVAILNNIGDRPYTCPTPVVGET